MDLSTNKISSEQIDRLIMDSKYAMNSLSISFPYSFVKDSVNLNWYDIMFAIDNGFLPHSVAIEHALSQIEYDETYSQDVLDLACILPSEAVYPHSIHPYINKLANTVSKQEIEITEQKLLYLVLKWVFEHQANYTEALKIVEIVYADFNYPKEISNFVRYMPMSQPDLGTIELNEERLYANWKIFLENQQRFFAK